MFYVAYGAGDLASGNVEILLFGDACFLNLFDDAGLADAVPTIQNARQVPAIAIAVHVFV